MPEGSPAPSAIAGSASAVHPGVLAQRLREHRQGLAWGLSGWRLRALLLLGLVGAWALAALGHGLAGTPTLDANWEAGPGHRLILRDSAEPALQGLRGQALVAVGTPAGAAFEVDARLLQRWPRWILDDSARHATAAQQAALARALEGAWPGGRVRLLFEGGRSAEVVPVARGSGRLGVLFVPLAALALLLMLCAALVVLARRQGRTVLYAVLALSQSASLLLIAAQGAEGLGLPAALGLGHFPLRALLDLCTGAAIVHGFALHPKRLPQARRIAAMAWAVPAGWLLMVVAVGESPLHAGWLAQASCLGLGVAATAVIDRSYRLSSDPYALVMRRFSMASVAGWAVATGVAALASGPAAALPAGAAGWAALGWHLFFTALLLLIPWLSRGREVLREFAVLAAIGTLATALAAVFMSTLPIGVFGAVVLAAGLASGLYATARLWFVRHLAGQRTRVTERTFDQLYRAAREVQARPQHYPRLLTQLLQGLFEPLEVLTVERVPVRSRVIGGGSALLVPLRGIDEGATPAGAMALRYAQRGERLFTPDDARLADRVIEQLRRAMAYDQAVERGRTEERLRIAQDLHDDIGARLLTLMYQAPTPEMEDYIRHTLQDLKTLTRGLATAEHRLSHAAAEWKADLTQRLSAAHVSLGWSLEFDADPVLTVVQWSALTRVLRELVTNALYHGHAGRIEVSLGLLGPELALQVVDDGQGRRPEAWAHGLGLGGVRKRVKLLGGEVAWRENEPCGIVCAVRIPAFVSHA